jgi:hypothetical protein
MPAYPSWLVRVPEILEQLRDFPAPFIDRFTIETLFHVRRRRAHQLMASLSGFQVGRTYLIDRTALIEALEQMGRTGSFHYERQRKIRIAKALDQARTSLATRKINLPAGIGDSREGLEALPANVHLGSGELRITFSGPQELLGALFELARAIQADYSKFEERTEVALQRVNA